MVGEEGGETRRRPRADFLSLVEMFVHQAYLGLGAATDSETGKPILELPVARHAIDMLGVLEEKTKGNLTAPERNYLENVLYQLRMTFLRVESAPREEERPEAPRPSPADSPAEQHDQAKEEGHE
jgi:hypothetical protein